MPSPTAVIADWLSRVNAYRAQAKLPPVTENVDWSASLRRHALYMVKTGSIEHAESQRSSPYFSADGSAAGEKSNVAGWSSASYGDAAFVDLWMEGPFHAVAILDPLLRQTAFGSYRDAAAPGTMKAAAALNVLSGQDQKLAAPASVRFPVMWPADGQTTTLTAGSPGEYPDPLGSCPAGYSSPTGVPIYVLLGPGPGVKPQVQSVVLKQATQALEACTFDGTNFRGADADATSLGRDILRVRSAIVIIPKRPLLPGARYTVALTNSGQSYSWSFAVSASGTAP
jgi:hypothetical protein